MQVTAEQLSLAWAVPTLAQTKAVYVLGPGAPLLTDDSEMHGLGSHSTLSMWLQWLSSPAGKLSHQL